MAVEENAVHGCDDWHLDSLSMRERVCAPGGRHAFGDRLLARQRFAQRRTLADRDADGAISTQRASTGEHEIAEAGEPAKVAGFAPSAFPSRDISASPRVISAA